MGLPTKVFNFRYQHPRCKYCRYHKGRGLSLPVGIYTWDECLAKKKNIKLLGMKLPRLFCYCYEVKDEDSSLSSWEKRLGEGHTS